MFITGEVKCF